MCHYKPFSGRETGQIGRRVGRKHKRYGWTEPDWMGLLSVKVRTRFKLSTYDNLVSIGKVRLLNHFLHPFLRGNRYACNFFWGGTDRPAFFFSSRTGRRALFFWKSQHQTSFRTICTHLLPWFNAQMYSLSQGLSYHEERGFKFTLPKKSAGLSVPLEKKNAGLSVPPQKKLQAYLFPPEKWCRPTWTQPINWSNTIFLG